MTQDRWQLAYAIYEAAALLAESERNEYVHAAAPDAELAAKVLTMLEEMEASAVSDAFTEPADSTDVQPPASSGSLPNGAMLGRFVVTGFLGAGGMGQVYSAHDPDLNREVALKVIAGTGDFLTAEAFIREAQAASALNHPSIATVYEVIRSGSMVAIAMELVRGTPFRELCGTPQPIGKVARWGQQIAHALAVGQR